MIFKRSLPFCQTETIENWKNYKQKRKRKIRNGTYWDCSTAASGWTGRALAHPEFGSSVNPITTGVADYAHHITASPPGFENPAAALDWV